MLSSNKFDNINGIICIDIHRHFQSIACQKTISILIKIKNLCFICIKRRFEWTIWTIACTYTYAQASAFYTHTKFTVDKFDALTLCLMTLWSDMFRKGISIEKQWYQLKRVGHFIYRIDFNIYESLLRLERPYVNRNMV